MKLFFKGGKHRIGIDTDRKVFCTDYFVLGGYKDYLKVSATDYWELRQMCIDDGYTVSEDGI